MGYTPTIDKTFKENWIACDLLIESSELRNDKTGKYSDFTYPFVKRLTIEMSKRFNQTGVYFTDEAQEGQDFDGIRTLDIKSFWEFDYAIIPEHLKNLYKSPPETHKIQETDNGLESWYAERWKAK